MESESSPSLVLDLGQCNTMAGYSDQEHPSLKIPTLSGRKKYSNIMQSDTKELYLGDDAFNNRGFLKLGHFIEKGEISNLDDYIKYIEYVLNDKLQVENPSELNVIMTENDRTNPNMRKQITQLMFESIGVNQFFIANQAVLSLYSTGRTTGLSVHAGDSGTQVVPIIDGYALSHGVNSQKVNGNDLTTYMQRLLFELNVDLQTTAELQIVREIKEKFTRVALDYDKELEQFST